MGQQLSHSPQTQSQPRSGRYGTTTETQGPERGRLARILEPSKTRYQPPAKYGSSTAVSQNTVFSDLDANEISSPAKFERQVVHVRYVENPRLVENGSQDPNSVGHISDIVATDYEATYAQVYSRSRRLVAQRSRNLKNEYNVPAASFSRQPVRDLGQDQPANGLGIMADVHRDGELVVLDFLDSTVLTGVPLTQLTEVSTSTSAPCRLSDSQNIEHPPHTQSMPHPLVDNESQSAIDHHEYISPNQVSQTSPVSTENELPVLQSSQIIGNTS